MAPLELAITTLCHSALITLTAILYLSVMPSLKLHQPAQRLAPMTTALPTLVRSTPLDPAMASVELRTSRPISLNTVLSLPLSPSMKISSPTSLVSTNTQLEALSVVTPSRPSVGVPRTARTTGSASTHGTTPGVTRAPSRSRWALAALTTKCTLVSPDSDFEKCSNSS